MANDEIKSHGWSIHIYSTQAIDRLDVKELIKNGASSIALEEGNYIFSVVSISTPDAITMIGE